ncbi:anti-sigma factor [Agrococcus beijingensis]|uniref:anti-sigma factor n=1 Tax=Agrococcus beijingensis TaxID=3068634 RepID=UPI0027427893|nr:anti-sigma factor [Agrococcus sp. REN33]
MQHLPDDALAALALGEQPAPDEAAHLKACLACHDEVASLRAAAAHYRHVDVAPLPTPAGVWERIAAEIAAEPGLAGAAAAVDAGVGAAAGDAAAGEPRPADAPVTSIDVARRRRRRFSAGALIAACAASAAVAATAAVLVVAQLNGPAPSANVAQAVLDPLGPLAPTVTSARAEVVEQDGQRLLIVDADALPQVDGYLDVWLLDAQAQQMVSLGVMDRAQTRLALPADLDLAAYPIVDVSIEPYDGDPTHSGASIWRGALEG